MRHTRGKHKQNKYFTLMLIPDSSAKVRSIRMGYWALGVLAAPVWCLIAIVVLLQVRVFSLEGQTDNPAAAFSAAAYADAGERQTPEFLENTGVEAQRDDDSVYERIDDIERKIADLLAKSEAIDGMKQDIVSVFQELTALNLPFSYNENAPEGTAYAVGGPLKSSPEHILDEVDAMLAELEAVFSEETGSVRAMADFSENLESFFRVRPTGWPAEGRISSEFGYRIDPFSGEIRERHDGIDIDAPMGTEVFATADGVVTTADWDDEGFGYLIVIQHGFGYSTLYAHNYSLLVSEGDEITRGQLIALVGNTGRSMGAHLHYEVRINDVPQNPQKYLNQQTEE